MPEHIDQECCERQIDKVFDLKCHKKFNLFVNNNVKYVIPHKKAEVSLECDKFIVTYQANSGKPSPGFVVNFATKPNTEYCFQTSGILNKGKKAFIMIESRCPQGRLISRNNCFTVGARDCFDIKFRADTEFTTIGILFFCTTVNYCLELDKFIV